MRREGTGKMLGAQVRRVEDPRVLLGKTQYVDDLVLPDMLAVAFVRSPYAHAQIAHIDAQAALAEPEVQCVLTGHDILNTIKPLRVEFDTEKVPFHKSCNWYVLTPDKVRFVGDMVAAVVATDRYAAEDAAALVEVEYEPLEPVSDMEQALQPDAPLVHEEWGDNVMERLEAQLGDVGKAFHEADCVVSERFVTGRHMASPMETRGCVAQYDVATDALTVWSSTQVPHTLRASLATLLGLPEHRLRVISPDVGGGFGLKAHPFPEEVLVTYVSRALRKPVKWIEDRREHLSASLQAKHQIVTAELALKSDGRILGLKARFLSDAGGYSSYPWSSAFEPKHAAGTISGPYKIPAFGFETCTVATNKASIGVYRGVGITIAALAMERLMDMGAQKLGLDPADIRLRNMISQEEHPYTTLMGAEIESGSHQAALQQALDILGYDDFRAEQQKARQNGRYLGMGIGSYVEGTAHNSAVFDSFGVKIGGYESATMRIDESGKVTVFVGTHSHGQGHHTVYAQLIADTLGVGLGDVSVVQGDTQVTPRGWGTWASRSAVTGGGAVTSASQKLRDKLLRIAARLTEVPADDLELAQGMVQRKTGAVQLLSIPELAYRIIAQPSSLPPDEEPGLDVTVTYEPPPITHSNATHVSTLEVDIETGQVQLLRYIVVEDCGTIINPMIVDGQIQGGVAQGIGSALYEHAIYDENGQFLTGTFMDYLIPTAADVPQVEIGHIETPSPYTLHGIKGMGEGGAIAPPAAIANAVADALSPFGVRVNEVPLTPERVLSMLDRARLGGRHE